MRHEYDDWIGWVADAQLAEYDLHLPEGGGVLEAHNSAGETCGAWDDARQEGWLLLPAGVTP